VLSFWAAAFGGAQTALAQPALPQRESAVKAAFLYKFGTYVEWPADTFSQPTTPFVIVVHGDDAVATDLEQLAAGRTLEGRQVIVRRAREVADIGAAHVLFVGNQRDARLREILAAVKGPVLVVSDQESGLRLGSVLNFSTTEGRVRFSASLPGAEARAIRLSSRLLAVAQSIEGAAR
jgi:hypothetical protein